MGPRTLCSSDRLSGMHRVDAFSPPALDVWTIRQMCRSLRTDRRETRREAWSQPPEPYGRCTRLGIRNPSLYRTSSHEDLRRRGCPDPVRVSARMRGLFICLTRKIVLSRDFPDGIWPTSAVGLSDDSTADREISKHSSCSVEGVSNRSQALMPPKTPSGGAFIAGRRRPSTLAPPSLAVSTVLAVIPAPSRVVAVVVSAP